MEQKNKIEVKKLVDFFGGKDQIVNDYSKILKLTITLKAVEKWIERDSLPSNHIVNFTILAQKKQLSFDLSNFFKKGTK